ncbi:MAG TPA: Nif3-like dinuclear metal center hexameric protein [Cryomorphaceae bacterium]|nr:Nif3-like dinuclear metal center hexameric protein [Cryomorphaceae bacterium]|tara:strand:+ start:1885 stop:2976 length:1092 start_codon:yes stop_codon:yes gene_type:complete
MRIGEIIEELELWAPPALQESYDNSGLIVGTKEWESRGVLVALDCLESVLDEAIAKNINLVVAHHPIVFGGLKRFNGVSYIERVVMKAIKHDVAIYAIHTNLDNVLWGVNAKIMELLGIRNHSILSPMKGSLKKFQVYVPLDSVEVVEEAVFAAGGGKISDYEECSFKTEGIGSFKGTDGAQPFIGAVGERACIHEVKLEFIVSAFAAKAIENAARNAHPYEEMAYEWFAVENASTQYGAGAVGELDQEMKFDAFLALVKKAFGTTLKYTPAVKETVKRVAVCGGSGSFLLGAAKGSGSDVFITADYKYHQFFDADGGISIFDVGHFESEQFTIDLIADRLSEKFPRFAVLKTEVNTNPIQYY